MNKFNALAHNIHGKSGKKKKIYIYIYINIYIFFFFKIHKKSFTRITRGNKLYLQIVRIIV